MKLLPSASVSSTSSFDANMCNSRSSPSGCFTGIFRRILCSGSLPTHPSDQIIEASSNDSDHQQEFKAIESIVEAHSWRATPGLVAKLMGLEALPELNSIETQMSSSSILRSKSMNDVGYREKCDRSHGHHRRTRSSTMSIHDMPTFIELENEEFFVLSFESGSKIKKKRSKERKRENSSDEFSPKGASGAAKLKKNKKKVHQYSVIENAEQPIPSSEDSSPVSVLDYDQFISYCEDFATEENSELNSRRKLSPELENINESSPTNDDRPIGDDQKARMIEESCRRSRKKNCGSRDNMNMWGEICKQSEAEVVEPIWVHRNTLKIESLEDVGEDIESAILEELLQEMVDQAGGLHI
ncbi:hypothetical protein HS088_TW02G00375 [Tripterygium wilfordii]|uniref:DUF3741 domain-containing protein n=1 Tax=Tripterygium wilfordii TaxID=458696 RepID=A0A7J7DY99_TRIWF|nr:uncharacterized protein LOC119980976 [Tripterygium wilfordii]KAF5751362.1 hypothetical protein HS088_TW02G00375 [Tripterygium wilfordii]